MAASEAQPLSRDSVVVGLPKMSKTEAISLVGEMLVEAGHVDPAYVVSMLTREETVSTFLGNGVAMPHGTFEGKESVRSTGLMVAQCPDGIEWGEGTAHLIIGLAAVGDDHIHLLAHIADVLQDEILAQKLWTTDDAELLYSTLSPPNSNEDEPSPIRGELVIGSGTGLHARPASLIVELAKGFEGEVLIDKEGRSAKANSILGLLSLGAVAGDEVTVTVSGGDHDDGVAVVNEVERILTTPESEL